MILFFINPILKEVSNLKYCIFSSLSSMFIRYSSHINSLGYLSVVPDIAMLVRKKETELNLNTSLHAVLSCRLREGYTIKKVSIIKDQIQVCSNMEASKHK